MQLQKYAEKYPGQWVFNAPLYNLTWFHFKNTYAKALWYPINTTDLIHFLSTETMDYTLIGNGSNTVLPSLSKLLICTKHLNRVVLHDEYVVADCGITNIKLINLCLKHDLGGIEFLYTIPGTLGGAVCSNAGAHGDEIANYIIWVEVFDTHSGLTSIRNRESIHFDYRFCSLLQDYSTSQYDHIITAIHFPSSHLSHFIQQGVPSTTSRHTYTLPSASTHLLPQFIITRIAIKLKSVDKVESESIIKRNIKYVEEKQPRNNTLGSTFKNYRDKPAWQLISTLDEHDLISENAYFSPLHRNFLINAGDCTPHEAVNLIMHVRQKILENHGIALDLEVKLVV